MKTAEEFLNELDISYDYGGYKYHYNYHEVLDVMKKYGAQVREEAAKIAEPYESGSYCRACGPDIAAAIRKMELP